MSEATRRKRALTIPRDLAIPRMRDWQTVKQGAMVALADELKRARLLTERKQRQVHAVCLQPGQEAMAESTIARAEKAQTLVKTGDIGLFKAAYLAYLYGLDFSRVILNMFPSLEQNAGDRAELGMLTVRLSPARMRGLLDYARALIVEQGQEDGGYDDGGWREVERAPIDLPARPRAVPDGTARQ